jgi:enamine deaminase RidA (YjgF/YER057c/UK114 family)
MLCWRVNRDGMSGGILSLFLGGLKYGLPLAIALMTANTLAASRRDVVKAVVFINSAEPQHNALARAIDDQLYHSKTLSKQIEVVIVDVNALTTHMTGAAYHINDTQGIWTEKYRPVALPALFCVRAKRIYPESHIERAQEIRSCL